MLRSGRLSGVFKPSNNIRKIQVRLHLVEHVYFFFFIHFFVFFNIVSIVNVFRLFCRSPVANTLKTVHNFDLIPFPQPYNPPPHPFNCTHDLLLETILCIQVCSLWIERLQDMVYWQNCSVQRNKHIDISAN